VETNSFRTAEALMRLELNGKTIYPDKFIPVAERNGTIHALTCIILNKVCKMIKYMEGKYDFDAVTVNCSAIEFSNKNLHKELLAIIENNNVPYDKIRIELTESAMSGDYETLINNVEKLRDVGIQFYLDDFGTGYSNLERILGCPFNTIKFDKSLLYKSIDDSRMDDLIVSMTQVFKKQGFTLLVEGVETDEQTQYSVSRGFSYIQGYKYAKPQPIEQLTNYFKNVCP
jgi:EAL domain-containing protein (putative c-di-GMP-specific phosphodiesterase class I)